MKRPELRELVSRVLDDARARLGLAPKSILPADNDQVGWLDGPAYAEALHETDARAYERRDVAAAVAVRLVGTLVFWDAMAATAPTREVRAICERERDRTAKVVRRPRAVRAGAS